MMRVAPLVVNEHVKLMTARDLALVLVLVLALVPVPVPVLALARVDARPLTSTAPDPTSRTHTSLVVSDSETPPMTAPALE